MTDVKVNCMICAWRETCQKKFSVSGRDARCAEFTPDITIIKQQKASPDDAPKKEDKP